MFDNKHVLEVDYIMGADKEKYKEESFYNIEPFMRNIPKSRNLIHDNINSLGFRSDNFTSNHSEKHILFLGCSFTWGTGLDSKQTWPYKVYKKILEKYKCSGYFNIASPGTSFNFQLLNLFKYIKLYGKPDVLFLNVTSILRFYGYDTKNKLIIDASYKDEYLPIFKINMYQNYLMLEQYCKDANIKIISFSWDKDTEKLLQDFNSFCFMNQEEINDYIINNISDKDIDNNSTALIAKDNMHHGEKYHDFWANKIYKKYLESIENEIN